MIAKLKSFQNFGKLSFLCNWRGYFNNITSFNRKSQNKIPPPPKKHQLFKIFFGIYAVVTSCKKLEYCASVCHKTWKASFWAPLDTRTAKKNFPQKNHWVNFKPLCCCNFVGKEKKSKMHWFFVKLEKLHFRLIARPNNFTTKFLPK